MELFAYNMAEIFNRIGEMRKILVLCTGNSCRSQMMEGWLRYFGKEKVEVYSAGVETHGVNETAIKVMRQAGVDISNHTSNNINEYLTINFDLVVTVCDHAKERCPVFPTTARKEHHNFTDPAKAEGSEEEKLAVFKKVRDEIRDYSRTLLEELSLLN